MQAYTRNGSRKIHGVTKYREKYPLLILPLYKQMCQIYILLSAPNTRPQKAQTIYFNDRRANLLKKRVSLMATGLISNKEITRKLTLYSITSFSGPFCWGSEGQRDPRPSAQKALAPFFLLSFFFSGYTLREEEAIVFICVVPEIEAMALNYFCYFGGIFVSISVVITVY